MNVNEAAMIAYAAGRDAGNRSARAAGRSAWNEDDMAAASAELERVAEALGAYHLVPPPDTGGAQ